MLEYTMKEHDIYTNLRNREHQSSKWDVLWTTILGYSKIAGLTCFMGAHRDCDAFNMVTTTELNNIKSEKFIVFGHYSDSSFILISYIAGPWALMAFLRQAGIGCEAGVSPGK